MKNFMKKIAALADEADEAGMTAVAAALDGLLAKMANDPTVLANKWDPAGDELDARHLEKPVLPNKWDPAGDELDARHLKNLQEEDQAIADASKAMDQNKQNAEIAQKHAEVASHLREIQRMFVAKGRPSPFILPAGPMGGAAIKAALKAIGITQYSSWADIHAKLNFFQATQLGADSLVENPAPKNYDNPQSLPPGQPKADLPMFLHERK